MVGRYSQGLLFHKMVIFEWLLLELNGKPILERSYFREY